jgi:hypothetical protein
MLIAASKCVFCEVGTKINETCSNSCPIRSQPCQKFGPCAYGMFTEIVGSGDTWCKTPWGIRDKISHRDDAFLLRKFESFGQSLFRMTKRKTSYLQGIYLRLGQSNYRHTLKMPLNTRKIGQDDVAEIGYGTMGLSAFYGKVKPDEERFEVSNSTACKMLFYPAPFQVLDAALNEGCTYWDTADVYGDSEDLIGAWCCPSFS